MLIEYHMIKKIPLQASYNFVTFYLNVTATLALS